MAKKTREKQAARKKTHPIDELIKTLSTSGKPLARAEKEEITFLVCLKCGARNPGEANYCMKCGQRLK